MAGLIEIFVPAVIFTGIVLALATVVLLARRRLEPHGPVEIDINGARQLTVTAGGRLLWTLAEQGILLPAACGGRGSCGQCRVTVRSGGGPLLPVEAMHIEPREAEAGVRLACMVKVREAMRIEVPRSALEAKRWICTVQSSRNVATYLRELTLELPEGERLDFTAGDYVVLEAPAHRVAFRDFEIDEPYRSDWSGAGLLGLESVTQDPAVRAYSLANPPNENDRAVLVVRIALPPASVPSAPPGQVSSYIFGLRPADSVAISGPYGEFHVADTQREMLFMAGGAGIAPIRSMVLHLLANQSSRKMSLWYGCRDTHDLCYYDDFNDLAKEHENFEFFVALSNQQVGEEWSGYTGFIHNVAHEEYLKHHPAPQSVEYYLCGPPLMSAAVVDMLDGLGVDRDQIYFDDFGS